MRTRITEYKVTVASNMATVHIKKPSDITLASSEATPEVYRITVSDENWDEDKHFLWDRLEGAWYEEGVTPVVFYSGTEPSVIISNGTTGASIVNPNTEQAYGVITAIEHTDAVAGGYTDAAKRTITEALRLIYDETRKVLLCSTAKKANIYGIEPSSETGYDIAISFNLTALAAEATAAGKTAKATAIGNIAATDMFTIAVDWGTSAENIIDALGDLQGSDGTVTLTAIYEYLAGQTPEDIPEGLGDRINLLLQFFGLPEALPDYHAMTTAEVLEIADEEWLAMYGFVAVPNTLHTVNPLGQQVEIATYFKPSRTYGDYGFPELWAQNDQQQWVSILNDYPTADRDIYTYNPSNNE